MKKYFNLEDINQIVIGAFIVAMPISFSEEAWSLGEKLPALNLLVIFILSIFFLSLFTYQNIFQGNIVMRMSAFIFRILSAYGLTVIVVALLLFSLDKLPLIADPLLTFKRLIIIAMPASMGAIIVDGFDKE